MKKNNKLYKILHTFESIYLCLKYPFLYPRNRFNNKHYNNWKLENYLNTTKNNKLCIKDKAWEDIIINLDYPDPNGLYIRTIHNVKNYFYVLYYYVIMLFYDFIIRPLHSIPTYTEWDMMPDGWKIAFGKQYLIDLKKQLKKDHILYSWRITDLKEKYGTLHLYCNYGSKDLYNIIQKYEDLSYYTCIKCGKPATKLSGGWICPYCDDCFNNNQIPLYIINNNEWVYNSKELKDKN